MNLKSLKQSELDQRMKTLAQKEREVLHEIILTIKEIDARQMYLELGYPNLFAYLVDEVGYAAGSAQRRIDAARLLRDVPSLGQKLESGGIGLGQISMIQKAAREVLQRTSVKVTAADKENLVEQLVNLDHRASQREVALFFDLPVIENTKQTTQADESVRYEFTVSKELDLKLKEAQALLSHALGGNDIVAYLTYVTEKLIKQKTTVRTESIKSTAVPKTESSTTANSTATVAVNFSARNKKILLKNQDCCQYRHPQTNKVCGSRWFRQVDHKTSRWADGIGSIENAQILCAAHNRLKYRKEMSIRTL